MDKIFEQCVVDGELTPELIKRRQELDQLVDYEISEVDAGRGQQWQPKEKQYAEIRQKYDDIWEQELEDAGYVVRPVFEAIEHWYENLSRLNEAAEGVEADPFAEFNLSASVEKALANYPYDFEIEYDGFVDTWEEDRFDPNSWYGHYTATKSREIDPYTYSLPVEDVLEDLMLIIPRSLKNPNSIEQAIKRRKEELKYSAYRDTEEPETRKLFADYQKLEALCDQVDGEAYYDDDHDKLRIFVADHLDHFFALFYPEFEENYRDRARESLW